MVAIASTLKVKTLDELAGIVSALKVNEFKISHCHGAFDLLHPGHIRHLEAAKEKADILIVTVTPDRYIGKGPGRPVFSEQFRAESIASLGCVDYVAIDEHPTAVEAIRKLKPDLYVKGSEYQDYENDLTGQIIKEEEAVRSVGGHIHFTNEITFSSTKLLNANLGVYPEKAWEFLQNFRLKGHSAENIIESLRGLKKLKVLAVGDTIIDQYCYCQGMGKSAKDNIITVKYSEEESFAGGIVIAANHLAGFCGEVHMVTCLGMENSYEHFIRGHLKPNVVPHFFYREDGPTVVKRRFIDPSFLSKMFEVAYLEDRNLSPFLEKEICDFLYVPTLPDQNNRHRLNFLGKNITDYDLVLVIDFGHGFIGQQMIETLSHARFLAVTAQTNSANMGFNMITKYPRADYICLDELELRLACHRKFNGLEESIEEISRKLSCESIAVTRGHHGSLVYSQSSGFMEIPVFSTEVVDRTGAGDAYLSITAPCVVSDMPMDAVGLVGNAVGALHVRVVGNRESVEPVPLFKFITALLK